MKKHKTNNLPECYFSDLALSIGGGGTRRVDGKFNCGTHPPLKFKDRSPEFPADWRGLQVIKHEFT